MGWKGDFSCSKVRLAVHRQFSYFVSIWQWSWFEVVLELSWLYELCGIDNVREGYGTGMEGGISRSKSLSQVD